MYLNISKTLGTANLRHDLHKYVAIYLSVAAVRTQWKGTLFTDRRRGVRSHSHYEGNDIMFII